MTGGAMDTILGRIGNDYFIIKILPIGQTRYSVEKLNIKEKQLKR